MEQFLGHVPADSGMAFVIVQHLDPTRKGLMPELLQRATQMKVRQEKNRTRVRPDCVDVIPPNKDMSLLHGVLHLLLPKATRGLRLPIDFFFRSLAQDQRQRSVGVILSGMGSDSTLGLRAIKEPTGVLLVQTPTTAKFDGMPRSVTDAGLADIVAPPFTKLDILTCRNLLIYLGAELQKKLMPLFHHNLNSGGLLFLGGAEMVGGFTELFTPLNGKLRLYRRRESALRLEPIEFPASFSDLSPGGPELRPPPKPSPSLQSQADQLVLARYAPPTALVNDQGDIFYISGRTGQYLEPAVGKANWNIFAMAREGLRYELTNAFQKALRQKGSVTFRGRTRRLAGGVQIVEVTVQQLVEPGPLHGLVITFADITASRARAVKLRGEHASLAKRCAQQTSKMEKALRRSRKPESTRPRFKDRGGQVPEVGKK